MPERSPLSFLTIAGHRRAAWSLLAAAMMLGATTPAHAEDMALRYDLEALESDAAALDTQSSSQAEPAALAETLSSATEPAKPTGKRK